MICDSEAAAGRLAAELLANRLAARGRLRVLVPAGRTPGPMYAVARELAAAGRLRTSGLTLLQLDEYAGIGPADPRSFAAYLRRELGDLATAELATIDGAAGDLDAEAARHQARIDAAPVDMAILGLGLDGHVAFNEPGSELDEEVHRVALAAGTRAAAAGAMAGGNVPDGGITTGLGTLMRCRELLLLVTGAHKARILREVLGGPPTPEVPASLLRAHPRLTVVCDPPAASALRGTVHGGAGHVTVVLGHREPGVSAEHRISEESLQRLQRAERLVHRVPTRAVVLTGYTSTDGLSEAEQMALAWRDPDVPALLEVAGTDTAANATRSLPLIEALGGISRVTVVTSFWHLRAPYFFALYRRRGLQVRARGEWRGLGWPQLLAGELAKLPAAPRERRRAWPLTASDPPA